MVIHKLDHYFTRRSSAAWAKYADAFRKSHSRVSIRDVAFQFLQALALVGRQAERWPVSRSAWRTQFRSVSPVHPNLLAIDVIAAHCDGCSGPCSRTIRMARSRTSAEYFLGLAMGSILSRNEPSEKPGTIQSGSASTPATMSLTTGVDVPLR